MNQIPESGDDLAIVESLSPRERQLLEMATIGHTDQAIANELGISLATVSTYWGRVRIKFGPFGRTEIVARFMKALMASAASQLAASEQKMRTVLDAAPVGIFLDEASGNELFTNAAYRAIVGDGDLTAADGTIETEWTRPDGSSAWIRVNSQPWIVNDQIAGRVGVVEDITAAREASDLRRQAEARYHLLFAMAPEAIVSVDESLNIAAFNASASRMFGYEPDEVVGQPLATLIPNRFRDHHDEYVLGFGEGTVAAARPMASRSQVAGLRRDGSEFRCEASIVRQFLGGHAHYTAILRDVTDRLRPDSNEGNNSISALPVSVVRLDPSGRILEASEVLCRVLGKAVDDLLGQPLVEFVHSEDRTGLLTLLNGPSTEGKLRIRTSPDGGDRWHAYRRSSAKSRELWFWDVHELETMAAELSRVRAALGLPPER